jgi:hypothetical protein
MASCGNGGVVETTTDAITTVDPMQLITKNEIALS